MNQVYFDAFINIHNIPKNIVYDEAVKKWGPNDSTESAKRNAACCNAAMTSFDHGIEVGKNRRRYEK